MSTQTSFFKIFQMNRHTFFCKWTATWRKLLSSALKQPLISSVYWFWYTLRYTQVLFSIALTFRLWEVVSVVDQFSNVSEVNTLCVTQVCKCFHYNTGFSLDTYRAWLLPESRLQPHSIEPSGCPPSTHPSRLLRVMTTQKHLTLGAGSAFCGSANSGQSSNAMSFRACSPHTPTFLHLLWYQQTGET